MKKLAVTGGISSGKSTVCRFFTELGAYVISADEIVHYLLSYRADVRQKIITLLGHDVVIDNQLNRQAIAKRAFSNPETLKSLELILHPLVFHEIELRYNVIKNDPKYNLFLAEIPLLYETNSESLFDFVAVVTAKDELCRARFNTKHPNENFDLRLLRHLSQEKKAAKADFILSNDTSLEELKKEVIKLANKLCAN